MKKWLLIILIGMSIGFSDQAIAKIAIVNIDSLFQQLLKKTGVSEKLENEFRLRENELHHMEDDLQSKMQNLQQNASSKSKERRQIEEAVMLQRQIFLQKAQSFEQDRQQRFKEERDKLIDRIKISVKKVAIDKNIDLVIDANAVAFNNSSIKDITIEVLKRV